MVTRKFNGEHTMRLNIVKSKNAEQLYIIKSYRKENGKTSSMIMKKLGTLESLLPKFDNDRDAVIAWAKSEAAKMTEEEKKSQMKVLVELSESIQNELGDKKSFNIGYLFLQSIFNQLGLDEICKNISSSKKIKYNLSDILAKLIYARIIAPSSKLSSFDYSSNFLQKPDFDLHQIYRALDVLSEESDNIQSSLYKNSLDIIDRKAGVLYYDCTNYFFELDQAKGQKQYGKSKEHRPNPIIQMGLFLDGSGLPLAFTMFPGNKNEQPSLKPLEQKILSDFNLSKFIVCTDAGLSSTVNRRFNNIQGRSFITTQSLKKIKSHLREWALSPSGFKLSGSNKEFNIEEIDEEKYQDKVFYKERWINEDNLEQRLIVSYSIKYRNYQREIRNNQIERAESIIEKGVNVDKQNPNSPHRFIDKVNTTNDGEVAENTLRFVDKDKIDNEKMYDGFYAVCTTLSDKVDDIIKINKQRWQIEAAFRTMKSEFKARPVYLHKDNRIEAHFLTCFIALLISQILHKKLKEKHTIGEIIRSLRTMNVHKLRELGYLPSYTRTELTDLLHETFGFRTDNEFISTQNMKKILKQTKKR